MNNKYVYIHCQKGNKVPIWTSLVAQDSKAYVRYTKMNSIASLRSINGKIDHLGIYKNKF